MNASDFLCAWCVDNPAITLELDDGKQRPVCRVCSAEEVDDPDRALTMTDRVTTYVTERPGCTSGAMRVEWKLDRAKLEQLIQVLRRLWKEGRLERTGTPNRYRYWPVAKKEAA